MELPELLNAAEKRWRELPLNPPAGSRDARESDVLARVMKVAEDALADGLLAERTGPDGARCWTWAPEHARLDEPAPFNNDGDQSAAA
jgi:hypothetical protein